MGILGCAQEYTAAIHAQGGIVLFYQIPQVSKVQWSRVIDDASTAVIEVPAAGMSSECCGKLAQVDAWGHELSIYRDGLLVWQGPILDVLEDRAANVVRISAWDVIGYLNRRFNHSAYTDYSDLIGVLMKDLIQDGFSVSDPNVLFYLEPGDISAVQIVRLDAPPGTFYIADQLRDFAGMGMDFTTIGRRILLRPEFQRPVNAQPKFNLFDKDFLGPISVRRSGISTATYVSAVGEGAQNYSNIGVPTDPFYGRVEVITDVDQQTNLASLQQIANDVRRESYPTPTLIVVPTDAQLSPSTPVGVNELVCCTRVDVFIQSICRTVQQTFKLVGVSGLWENGTESIGISLGPFPEL